MVKMESECDVFDYTENPSTLERLLAEGITELMKLNKNLEKIQKKMK